MLYLILVLFLSILSPVSYLLFPLRVIIYTLFIGCTIATIVFLVMNYDHKLLSTARYDNPWVIWCVPSIDSMQHKLSLFYIIIIIVLSLENKYTIQKQTVKSHAGGRRRPVRRGAKTRARIPARAKLQIFATPMLTDRRTYENRNSAYLLNMGVAKSRNLAHTRIWTLGTAGPISGLWEWDQDENHHQAQLDTCTQFGPNPPGSLGADSHQTDGQAA